MFTFDLCVERVEALAPRIKRFILATPDGRPVPAYTAGAHLEFEIPHEGGARAMHRAYSLVSPWDESGRCEIAVQLEPGGAGGSRWMHALAAGATLKAATPRNQFELDARPHSPLLLAAGIGVTPILCMARELRRQGGAFELHYLAREAALAAYREEIESLPGAHCWFDGGDPAQGPDLRWLIGAHAPQRHLYVCGPKPFIAAVLDTARALGWPEPALHCELFSGSLDTGSERPFTVVLAASGHEFEVPADRSVMDVMEARGLDPLFDCRRGECGICATRVLAGEADHRDICLSAQDRAAGQFCPCVSRALSGRLVLEL